MASSISLSVVKVEEYPYPSHVNVANFVSIKLSSKDKYFLWNTQMLCLIVSHDMHGFIDGTFTRPKDEADYVRWRRSDTLLRGWILVSLSEDALTTVAALGTAKEVWTKLQTTYGAHSNKAVPSAPTQKEQEGKVKLATPAKAEKDLSYYQPLCKAAQRGDWEEAQTFFDQDQDALTANIDEFGYTALHMAIVTGDKGMHFVEKLLELIPSQALPDLKNAKGSTALHFAASIGNTKAAKILVKKNLDLLHVKDGDDYIPLHKALFNFHRKTFLYLLDVTKDNVKPSPFSGYIGVKLLVNVIFAGYFDLALRLVERYPALATTKLPNIQSALMAIARNVHAYRSGSHHNFVESLIYSYVPVTFENYCSYKANQNGIENQANEFEALTHTDDKVPLLRQRNNCNSVLQRLHFMFWNVSELLVPHIKKIRGEKLYHFQALELVKCLCDKIKALNVQSSYSLHYIDPLIEAASNGAYEVVQVIVDTFPSAIQCRDNDGNYITQIAVLHRCEKVYNLMNQMSMPKHIHITLKDPFKNNILHLAGRLAPPHKLNLVSGAALQMQRELQWFKEVEMFVDLQHPKYKTAENRFKETPKMVFTREHEDLVKEGEEWMKKTADSYTITAALIITIVFAAAITVPGGNNGDTGEPIFNKRIAFIIFAISDAISLFTSTTSLLLFLSILTARYAEQDFLFTLPKRLIYGLATLFLSTTSMMIAFSATLYIMFGQGKAWILFPIGALTCLPISSFVTLQFPLLVDLISSTYGRGLCGKHRDRTFD